MRFDILTIFPEAISGFFSVGVIGQAQEAGVIEIHLHNLRDFTDDPHRVVDDRPYGGGPGMVMKVEPFVRGIEAVKSGGVRSCFLHKDCAEHAAMRKKTHDPVRWRTILLSAQGKLFTEDDAIRLGEYDGLILLCGRYEGVDERITEFIDEELSIGDYILTGGELAAAVIVEATARTIPGVVGDFGSVESDSFFKKDRLGPPQYTRPPVFRGLPVPEVLMSGDHKKIEEFRARKAWEKTMRNRPDLLGLDLDRENPDG